MHVQRVSFGPCVADVELGSDVPPAVLEGWPAGDAAERLRIRVDGPAPLPEPFADAPARADGAGLRLQTPFVAGYFDPEQRRAEVLLGAGDAGCTMERKVYSALRLVFGLWLGWKGGLALHGCALERGGRAYAFMGRTGAGKTTLVRRFPADALLGDDLVALLPDGDGWLVCGTPFSGRERLAASLVRRPLAAISVLGRGEATEARVLSRQDAVRAILRHAFVFEAGQAPREAALAAALAVSAAAPAYGLALNLEASPWVLEAYA